MAECYYCGRRFPQLILLTIEDIQREHLGAEWSHMACADCRDKIRLAAHLVPEQSLKQTARNFSWMIPIFSVVLILGAMVAAAERLEGLGGFAESSRWLGMGAVFVGALMVWNSSKYRYGFTHDLKWTLNSKKVNVALAVVLAGIIVFAFSAVLPG